MNPDAPAPIRMAAIVGRPNVGKSALFNRLAGRSIAIVHDQPGITRDRLGAECQMGDAPFEITDTGGIGADVDVGFTDRVRAEAEIAIATAGVILFVVDGQSGVLPLDLDVAKRLRRSAKDVLLVVNKIDQPELASHQARLADFAQLGFPEVYGVSAAHGQGLRPLVAAVERRLPPPLFAAAAKSHAEPPKLALVGRPNVGKSSLTNAILGEARTIVSPVAGTTRDSVDVPATVRGRPYVLIDTAGLRHRGKRDNSAEVFSAVRSERGIRRADLCILVLDALMGVTQQDRQIAGLIQEAGKPCVVAVNKWDLLADDAGDERTGQRTHREEWLNNARAELFFLPYAPFVAGSALNGEEVERLFKVVEKVRRGAAARVGTGPLNRLLRDAVERQPPPMRGNQRLKLLYATQVAGASEDDVEAAVGEIPPAGPEENGEETSEPAEAPARKKRFSPRAARLAQRPAPVIAPPTFLLFVNDRALMTDGYRRYLENCLRETEPYSGLPVFFKLRGREARSAG